jgi:hypothetical protein
MRAILVANLMKKKMILQIYKSNSSLAHQNKYRVLWKRKLTVSKISSKICWINLKQKERGMHI